MAMEKAVTNRQIRYSQTPLNVWVQTLLEQAAAAFGKADRMTQLEADSHLEAWASLASRVGRVRFEKGLKSAISECEFFPKVGQTESRLPRGGAKRKGVAEADCSDCDGTGFRLTNPAERRFSRCPCWSVVEA